MSELVNISQKRCQQVKTARRLFEIKLAKNDDHVSEYWIGEQNAIVNRAAPRDHYTKCNTKTVAKVMFQQ